MTNSPESPEAEVCEVCGSTAGPLATVTTDTAGGVRHRAVCQSCAAGGVGRETVRVRRAARMCVRCNTLTSQPVVVSEVHAGSGPGFNVYACPECAPHLPVLPDALDLLESGWRKRTEGGR
ncbi:hypothetical protein QCN29_13330 [Streptomyces sp. HNM0663]|uniref:Small CPxCG-related zinc finger protein n=1 Tax=Streptomyces chengmaiensis TaxID=3040919 RepID=A0ABT6HLZ5_9ACTN|nr:hypothetical protein [Streptomyces chengmaiensis]MDH2389759.1 hypothetical protein [Streptomyces chengmaiensis]